MMYIAIAVFTLVFVVLPFVVGRALAQTHDRYPVVACLGDVNHMRTWRGPVSEAEWARIAALEGISVRDEVNSTWLTPPDMYFNPIRRYHGIGEEGQPIEIWVSAAPSTPEATYWFVFNKTDPEPTENEHVLAIHPCGSYRVEVTLDDVVNG